MSALGMNDKGEVRSASEFKTIFEQTGESHRPYRCPFCEVDYEDRCIITECKKAPHFKLPNGTDHRGRCNGETGEPVKTGVEVLSSRPGRKVVGDIDYPTELVPRRAPLIIKRATSGANNAPDDLEIVRRRKAVASDQTLSTNFTSSDIRSIVHAYKVMRKEAYDIAIAEGLGKGTPDYNASFKETLESHPLVLYRQPTTYRRAFQSSKLHPSSAARIYHGNGTVTLDGDDFVIVDNETWPLAPRSAKTSTLTERGKFEVRFPRAPADNAPTSHRRALSELEGKIGADFGLEWYAYGTPQLDGDTFTLLVSSMDHLYWTGKHQR